MGEERRKSEEKEMALHTRILKIDRSDPDPGMLEEAGGILRAGGLVAFPTETVYGLGGHALDPAAAKKIYAAKGRPSDNPLIVHIADRAALDALTVQIPEAAERLTRACWPGPLTIILKKSALVPYETTGGLDTVAVRLPDDDIARGMIRAAGGYVAAPSANRSGRPSPTGAAHVYEDLNGRIDLILDGGPVRIGLESTIVDFTREKPEILRPGFYGKESLEQILGEVHTDPALATVVANADAPAPRAPGMKYRHYAPRGELTLVKGERAAVAREIRGRVRGHLEAGEKAGVICAQENRDAYPEGEVRCIGSLADEESIARGLYAALRDFDSAGVSVIYSETFETPRLGPAIMNRLLKAAGGRLITKGDTGMGRVIIMDHPLIQHKIGIIREISTGTKEFREMVSEIAMLECYESTRDLSLEDRDIETPMAKTTVKRLSGKKIAIIPILRAGLGMVSGMQSLIPAAKVGHIGMYRDHDTLEPVEYYCKLPADIEDRDVFVVDPMLATGGSACDAIRQLKKHGCSRIRFLCIIAAPEGLERLQKEHPDVDIIVGALDDHLNEIGYIVPGLGDAGDRIFGTK